MNAYHFVTILALGVSAYAGKDLEEALAIMDCAKSAIAVGVPELNIPSHKPYVAFKESVNWSGDISLAKANITIEKMVLVGVADWNLTGTQTSSDSDSVASFDFQMEWDWLQINGSYSVDLVEVVLEQDLKGTFAIDFNKTSWKGSISFEKEGNVTNTKIDWDVENVNVNITGLGSLTSLVETTLSMGLKNALNEKLIGNAIGTAIEARLNKIWWPTGKVWKLTDWCKNNTNSYYI